MKENKSLGFNFYKIQFVPIFHGDGSQGHVMGLFAKNYSDAKRKILNNYNFPALYTRRNPYDYDKVVIEILDSKKRVENLPKDWAGGDFLKFRKISYESKLKKDHGDSYPYNSKYEYFGVRILEWDTKRIRCTRLYRDKELGVSCAGRHYLTKQGILPEKVTITKSGSKSYGPPV